MEFYSKGVFECKCYVFKRIVAHEVLSNASLLPKKKKVSQPQRWFLPEKTCMERETKENKLLYKSTASICISFTRQQPLKYGWRQCRKLFLLIFNRTARQQAKRCFYDNLLQRSAKFIEIAIVKKEGKLSRVFLIA